MQTLKILIPTDFSVQAEYAFLMVQKLQEKLNAEVHFLHVMNVPDTVTMDKQGNIQTCGEIDVKYVVTQKEIAQRKLQNLKQIYGNDIQVHFELGKVTDAILSFSTSNQFDLIVMGTKGAWGMKEKLSGSETQLIARKSSIPVLSLMCDRSDLTIHHILLVHDFSDYAHEDLSLLRTLTKAFQAKVHQLQILSAKQSTDTHAIIQAMDTHARKNGLDNYENHLLNDMDVENGVIHFNQMHDMDLVCIGTHGKGSLLHSSAAEKLINHLFKPIISFHIKN
jgi:nucleotide-binding universal stress UspA family protein